MDPVEALRCCGGSATLRQLRALRVTKKDLKAARLSKTITVPRRGRYHLAELKEAPAIAHELTATLSHRSAAIALGLPVATTPEKPEVTVRRNRKLLKSDQKRVSVTWRDLPQSDVKNGITTPLRTVLDCARDLPFTEALAVADSALREKLISHEQLTRAAAQLRGPGCRAARLVARHANELAAGPFESVLRALAIEAGLDVRPQVHLTENGVWAMVDLLNEELRLVIEAESFEHHATRKGFRKDVRRYTQFVVFGWAVLRFTWEDVMLQPEYVRWALRSWRLRVTSGQMPTHPPSQLARLA
ncbi:DUF559 domain-containing protein [Ornithinimicrobium sp. Y1847]|uniref:DUF559 domain-containing protein n=1 Tax=Ornithinimicrobium sp. Y1847 TaxID=3405419 RepID=UPI003B671A15